MKISFYALCVLLPALCMSTPLPTNEAIASSDADAKAQGQNANANAKSSASAVAEEQATPTTQPSGKQPSAKATSESEAQAKGPSAKASSSSSASASSSSCAPTGKPKVQGFTDYDVVVFTEGDLKKFANVEWYAWKTTQIKTESIQTKTPVCTPRYYVSTCKGSAFKFIVKSETEVEYVVFGTDETTVVELKQSLSIVDDGYHIFQTQVTQVAQATIGSEQVTLVEEKDTFASYFDQVQFAVLATDYESYLVTVTNGEERVISVSVSVDMYQDENKKQEIWSSITQVLSTYSVQESEFIEITSTFDYKSYKWEECGQGGSTSSAKASSEVSAKTKGQGGEVSAKTSSEASTNNNNSPRTTPSSGKPSNSNDNGYSEAKATGEAEASSKNGNASATSESSASASSGNKNSGKGNQSGGKGSSSGNSGGAFVECSEGDVSGFEEYSIIVKSDKFFTSINEKVFYLWKITEVSEKITVDDVGVCVDRYACDCQAVKFQYVQENGGVVLKEWGYDGNQLLYVQEKLTYASEKVSIFNVEVEKVMKATKDTDVAVSVKSADQIKTYLSSSYAILGTDGNNFVVCQTSTDSGSVTFIGLVEQYYKSEEKQEEIYQLIVEVLQRNSIDEKKLSIVLKGEFDVDTNKYKKVTQSSKTTSKGGKTTSEQENTTECSDASAKSKTSTSVSNGNQPSTTPSGGGSSATASGISEAESKGGGQAKASSESEASANNDSVTASTKNTAEVTGNGSASSKGEAEAGYN